MSDTFNRLEPVEVEGVTKGFYNPSLTGEFTVIRPLKGSEFAVDGPFTKKTPLKAMDIPKDAAQAYRDALAKKNEFWGMFRRGHQGYATGADPEIFAVDAKGEPMTSDQWIAGGKKAGNLYRDGILGEMAPLANTCLGYFGDHVHSCLETAYSAAHRAKGRLTTKNVFEFSDKRLREIPAELVLLGCAPSYSAYGEKNDFGDPYEIPIRSAGGHIHMGVLEPRGKKAEDVNPIVQGLDALVGVAGVSLAEKIDDPRRRRYYGRAGEFRLPKHGLEYRVLSNFWLCHPAVFHLTMEWTRAAYQFAIGGVADYLQQEMPEVRRIINETDVDGARKFIKKYKKLFLQVAAASLPGGNNTCKSRQKALDVIEAGVHSIVKTDNLEQYWMLGTSNWVGHCEGKDAQWGHFV